MARPFCGLSIVVVATCAGVARGASPAPLIVLRQALLASNGISAAADGGAVSGDGRFVAFVSRAQLLRTDTRGLDNVYVFDRVTGTLTLESAAPDGSRSDGTSLHPRLSADGRYVVFASEATNLAGGPDTNKAMDVFARDRRLGITRRISLGADGREGNGASSSPAISDDGRVAVFESNATNLLDGADANGTGRDIYLASIDGSGLARVSVDSEGRQPANGESFSPAVSGDGGVVAFASTARPAGAAYPPPAGGARPAAAVFVRDRRATTTTCVSCGAIAGDRRRAYDPHISSDGRFVVFTSAREGASRSGSMRTDIAVHDRASSETTLVTHGADASSVRGRIAGNGRFIVFESLASNLACRQRGPHDTTDENLLPDIYLFERLSRTVTRLSRGAEEWWAPSISPWVDAEGTVAIFSSRQPMGPDDPTTDFDLFVHPLDETTGVARGGRGPPRAHRR